MTISNHRILFQFFSFVRPSLHHCIYYISFLSRSWVLQQNHLNMHTVGCCSIVRDLQISVKYIPANIIVIKYTCTICSIISWVGASFNTSSAYIIKALGLDNSKSNNKLYNFWKNEIQNWMQYTIQHDMVAGWLLVVDAYAIVYKYDL